MFFNSKNVFALRAPIKHFESAPPVLGRLGYGKQTIFQMYNFLTRMETERIFSDFRSLNELFIKSSFEKPIVTKKT